MIQLSSGWRPVLHRIILNSRMSMEYEIPVDHDLFSQRNVFNIWTFYHRFSVCLLFVLNEA